MTVKVNDLTLSKEKLENEYRVVQVFLWQKNGEALGQTYECVLPKFRSGKISVKVKSETPVVTKETLDEEGMVVVRFDNLMTTPWGRVNRQSVSYGLTTTVYKATLVLNKWLTTSPPMTC